MEGTIIAAIIASSVAILTGITNIFLTLHRNKQDGVTYYRMQWIDNVREEFAIILSWNWCSQSEDGKIIINSIENLEKSIYKTSLYLNVKDNYDQNILNKMFEYLEAARKTYNNFNISTLNVINDGTKILLSQSAKEEFNKVEKLKSELLKLTRVYLKTEWTRVKCDSSICKCKYHYCWKPFKGFQADMAVKKFMKEYKEI